VRSPVALAGCRNHRKWFAGFARPYLGDCPIEIGSGLGDYAREWIPLAEKFTVTDADETMIIGLKREMAGYPNVDVQQVLLPSTEQADHSCLICYNVLEHIDDHIGALRSMARLVRSGAHIVLVCPAFPFAMSAVDIATGHVRRYTKRSMTAALTEAGLEAVDVRYANQCVYPSVDGVTVVPARASEYIASSWGLATTTATTPAAAVALSRFGSVVAARDAASHGISARTARISAITAVS
jgi:ubiquinone/menaquinone biosynthesis C-methylase UbiE